MAVSACCFGSGADAFSARKRRDRPTRRKVQLRRASFSSENAWKSSMNGKTGSYGSREVLRPLCPSVISSVKGDKENDRTTSKLFGTYVSVFAGHIPEIRKTRTKIGILLWRSPPEWRAMVPGLSRRHHHIRRIGHFPTENNESAKHKRERNDPDGTVPCSLVYKWRYRTLCRREDGDISLVKGDKGNCP